MAAAASSTQIVKVQGSILADYVLPSHGKAGEIFHKLLPKDIKDFEMLTHEKFKITFSKVNTAAYDGAKIEYEKEVTGKLLTVGEGEKKKFIVAIEKGIKISKYFMSAQPLSIEEGEKNIKLTAELCIGTTTREFDYENLMAQLDTVKFS